MRSNRKVSVVGVGSVGAATSYALAISGQVRELVLVDINKDKAQGEALDIIHGSAFLGPIDVKSGDYEETKDSDVVVITAGVPQRPGESRLELVDRNIAIFKQMIPEIVKYSPDAILLVVANPVDILTRVTLEISGFPKERVIGSGTMLDSSRLRNEIAQRFGIGASDVEAMIMGEHGDSGFPVWSSTRIQGIDIEEYSKLVGVDFNDDVKAEIASNVVQAAYEVINKKGATYYAIGLSCTAIVSALLNDSKRIMPVGALINDYYGAEDIYLGVPCILGKAGIEKILKIELNDEEIEKFNSSAKTLKDLFEKSFK